MKKTAFAAAALFALFTARTVSAQDIDTTPGWNGSDFGVPFGDPNTATYGQTFTLGTARTMTSFTFWLANNDNGGALQFDAYVMGWDGTKATGSVLWSSPGYAGTGSGSMVQYDFSTGGLGLGAGSYVAFLNASPYIGGDGSTQQMGMIYDDVLAGGSWVYMNNGSNFADLTTYGWSEVEIFDTAFRADFEGQVTPEPVTMILLGTGLASVGAARRRRKT